MISRLGTLARATTIAALSLALFPCVGRAQVQYSEDFTGATTNNPWFFYNGACLTAGTSISTTSPGYVPACTTILQTYYNVANASTGKGADPYLVGGYAGYLGSSKAPSSVSAQVADPVGNGALRFTNGYPYGYHENGAIVSDFTFPTTQGLEITFKTVTYLGDSGGSLVNGNGKDGADGMSFYLLDGCMPLSGGTVPSGCSTSSIYGTTNTFPGIGAWGGSLAYTCSNANPPYDGLVGAYLGLGIDEYGNFLNGTKNTLSEPNTSASGDNTYSGGGYQPGRIGLRGAGDVSWAALTTAYGVFNGSSSPYYPASLTTSCVIKGGTIDINGLCSGNPTDAMMAVQKTCSSGNLYNYGGNAGASSTPTTTSVKSPTYIGPAELSTAANTAGILDYDAMKSGTVGAYSVLPSVDKIANESAKKRGSTTVANYSSSDATPITYRVKITPDGLLSFAFSYNGGAWQPVITGQNITTSNGPLPKAFRFGFAGSTGGSTNVHEVLCFKAAPAETSQSSGGINVYENPTIKFGTQLFLAYYFPSDWSGQLTAQSIGYDTSLNKVVIASTPTWDARCVLTGVNSTTGTCSTGVTSMDAESPSSRTMLTWNGTQGVPFEWSSLTAAQQAALDQGDPTQTSNRLNYLRGDRTNEMSSTGTCPQSSSGIACFRQRSSVLSDIVDSSPTWVGPPQSYDSSATWTDQLYPSATAPESAGESYTAFKQAEQSRLNVVYVGANDGFLHGFRAGSLDTNGNLVNNSSTPNDGYEVLAYMPATVLQNIHNSTDATLDYANTQYAHDWFTDATPGTGDVFYADSAHPNGGWHTWLVGGLGPGGAAIYALDVTDPSTFEEANAKSIVIGEWTASNLTCVNVANCGQYLGNTYGTPLIRRFHNGEWGVIFGNGLGSANGTAGIFIMLISPKDGSRTFYYLPTGSTATGNGIASTGSADLDLDHIVDYIYAGDLKGNVWRFDVTSQDPAKWAVSASSPLFTTPSGQPITTSITVSTLKQLTTSSLGGEVIDNSKPERVIINFGTGQITPETVSAAAQYASGQQYIFGIWDWDMNAPKTSSQPGWNVLSPSQQAVGLDSPQTITMSTLEQQTITTVTPAAPATAYRTVTQNPVCWVTPEPNDTSSTCPNPGTQFGWYMALPATGEQVIFNPTLSPDGELVVNTYIPVQDSPLSCSSTTSGTGFTMAVQPGSGSGSTSGYFTVDTNNGTTTTANAADGVQLNGTGIPWFISSGEKGDNNAEYLITQTSSGPAPPMATNRHVVVAGKRLNWIQRR